mgnify:CR=1 FL=1
MITKYLIFCYLLAALLSLIALIAYLILEKEKKSKFIIVGLCFIFLYSILSLGFLL